MDNNSITTQAKLMASGLINSAYGVHVPNRAGLRNSMSPVGSLLSRRT